jgi:1-acyl-sn-glycerol-3-phosphate acyltransferase
MHRPLSTPTNSRIELPPIPSERTRARARAVMRFLAVNYFKVEVVGREHAPRSGPAIVIPNHPSFLDPFLVGWGLSGDWVTWMAWDEAFDWPVIGPIMRSMEAVPVNLDRASSQSLKVAYALLKAERMLGVFFEGKRTIEGNTQINEPLEGAARIALRSGARIHPVTIAGVRRLWGYSEARPKRGPIRVTYHPPIDPSEFRGGPRKDRARVLTEHVGNVITSALPGDGRHRDFS